MFEVGKQYHYHPTPKGLTYGDTPGDIIIVKDEGDRCLAEIIDGCLNYTTGRQMPVTISFDKNSVFADGLTLIPEEAPPEITIGFEDLMRCAV